LFDKHLKRTIQFFHKIFKKIAILIINIIVLFISLLIKKDDNMYILGSSLGCRFADNSMYLYIYLNEFTDKRTIWITKDIKIKEHLTNKGLEVYSSREIRGIYYQLKAKYHVVDNGPTDINPFLSIRALKVMLWHGIPIKKLPSFINGKNKILDLIKNSKYYKLFLPGGWDPKNIFLLSTSQKITSQMLPLFPLNNENIIIANYPRNEMNIYYRAYVKPYLSNSIILLLKHVQVLKKEGYFIFGYFPTFRDWGEDIFFSNDKETLKSFLEFLNDCKVVVVTKFHFGVKFRNNELNNLKNEISHFENVILLEEVDDINAILPDLDLLISDYSGVIYDFLWYEKPIILYPYDQKKYEENRGFSLDYDAFNPGKKVYNIFELKSEIEEFLNNPKYIDNYLKNIQEIRKETFDTDISCMQIVEFLEKIY